MVTSVLSTEGRKFCQTTSIRGIPRIINAKSTVHSVIWLLGVLFCTGVLIWQLVVVFLRYKSYPVNSVFSQSPEWDNTTFPDITICNLCSLIYENEMPINYPDYLTTFTSQFTMANFQTKYHFSEPNSTLEAEYYNALLSYYWNTDMYFLNFPILNSNVSEPIKNSPILGCSYFNWDYSPNDAYDCGESVQEIWDQGHYKCYTLKLRDSLRKQIRGFSAVIYVDDIVDNIWMTYNLDITKTRAAGMKVLIHEPGTQPDMKLGIVLDTGKSTSISLEQTKITRLPDPYSNCTNQQTLGSVDELSLYTRDFCIDVCLQEQYLKACGCIIYTYQFTKSQYERANNSICGNISITINGGPLDWKGFEQVRCKISFNEMRSSCYNQCHLPCEELMYSSKVSSATWPHITSQLSFYLTYIRGNSRFGNKFSEYESDLEYNFRNRSAALRILQKLNSEGLIRDNFLQLNVQFKNNAYNQAAEVIAFSVDAFGAQLGGVLSLWLGVTILLIFEICEFFINLLTAGWFVKRNSSELANETIDSKF